MTQTPENAVAQQGSEDSYSLGSHHFRSRLIIGSGKYESFEQNLACAEASGAEMVIGLANSLTWQFSGPDTYSANTLIDFTLVQPFLRGAGRGAGLQRCRP